MEEGNCSTPIILRGLKICTESETISLRGDKLARSREFLANPCFDPGATRIELKVLQELRGKAEHWGLRNITLAPEMHAIDRLLCSYRGLSRPHGKEDELKQVYFDFLDHMGIFRINMSDPEWWCSAYRSSFSGVLSRPDRPPFNPKRDRSIWIGPDATLDNGSAVDHANGMFTVFEASIYTDFLSEITGLPRGDYELIAITEFLILIAFLIERAPGMSGCVVCYVGDNQNVATWAKWRIPGNRVPKYFARILNRLEHESNFTAIPVYISTLTNKLQGGLSLLAHKEAIKIGQDRGLKYVDVGQKAKSYFGSRVMGVSLIPPLAIQSACTP